MLYTLLFAKDQVFIAGDKQNFKIGPKNKRDGLIKKDGIYGSEWRRLGCGNLKNVCAFKHLGVTFSNGKSAHLQEIRQAIGQLNSLLGSGKIIKTSKILLYKSIEHWNFIETLKMQLALEQGIS